MGKKVAILGFKLGSGDYREAPFEDKDFEIWCMNSFWKLEPQRYDRWFEIHSKYNILNFQSRDHWEWLKKCTAPVYMCKKYKAIPNSIQYPIAHMLREFGPIFTNSADYMLALAIHERFEEIHCYGLMYDHVYNGDIFFQRPSYTHFLGWIKGLGIKLYIPPGQNILRQYKIYGDFNINPEEYYQYL